MTGRVIAIGDVHGCAAALAALLEAVRPTPEDTVVTLGDYIDRGPDSRGVIEQLIALAGRCCLVPLLGNHEEMLLAARSDLSALQGWLTCGGIEALASYGYRRGTRVRDLMLEARHGDLRLTERIPEEHWRFLSSCSVYGQSDTHLFVHAGYNPDLPMGQQPASALRWDFLDRRTARPHCSGKVAIVGHTPQRNGEVLDLGFLKCIDTGCHAGGWLTALDVQTGRLWQADIRGNLRHRAARPTP